MDLPPPVEDLLRVLPVPMVPEVELAVAPDVTALWAATAGPGGGREAALPYWAVSWPAGRAIARYVLDRPELVRGRRVLDLGCGSGLQAIAAARAGAAEVTANDVDPLALAATRRNALHNGVTVSTLADDLLAAGPAGSAVGVGPWDVVLAGDVCYQRDLADAALAWLRAAAGTGATVVLADCGRPYAPTTGLDELARYDVPVDEVAEGTARRHTRIWRLRPD